MLLVTLVYILQTSIHIRLTITSLFWSLQMGAFRLNSVDCNRSSWCPRAWWSVATMPPRCSKRWTRPACSSASWPPGAELGWFGGAPNKELPKHVLASPLFGNAAWFWCAWRGRTREKSSECYLRSSFLPTSTLRLSTVEVDNAPLEDSCFARRSV